MFQLIPDESVRRVQLLGDAESSWKITPLQNSKMFWNQLKCCLQVKRVPPFSKWLYGARTNIHPSGRTNCCSILFAHPIKIQLDKYINVVKQRQHIRHYFLHLFACIGDILDLRQWDFCHVIIYALDCNTFRKWKWGEKKWLSEQLSSSEVWKLHLNGYCGAAQGKSASWGGDVCLNIYCTRLVTGCIMSCRVSCVFISENPTYYLIDKLKLLTSSKNFHRNNQTIQCIKSYFTWQG